MIIIVPFMVVTMLLVAAAFMAAVGFVVYRLAPADPWRTAFRWVLPAAAKGVALPFLLWVGFNCGFLGAIQPLMPSVQAAQNAQENWLWPLLVVSLAGMFAITSYWAACSFGWLVVQSARGLSAEARPFFRGYCITWTCVTLLPALMIFWLGGWLTLGLALTLLLMPIAGYTPSIAKKPELPPMYARAIAKMKFGKYTEAEWEIIHQLERHQNDFGGWMMLAKLYAEEYRDLPEAEQTVLEICNQPNVTNSDVSVALHKLADWQLQIGDNPDAARRALWAICNRMPGTHLAHMAEVRVRSLPRSREELLEQREHRPIALSPLSDTAQALTQRQHEPMPRERAVALAQQLTARLREEPGDLAIREKLARLLAEELDQLSAGVGHIQWLLRAPETLPAQRAGWLGCIAGWHLQIARDRESARRVLEELVRDYPDSPEAKFGQRRLKEIAEAEAASQPPPLPKVRIRINLEPPGQ